MAAELVVPKGDFACESVDRHDVAAILRHAVALQHNDLARYREFMV